ncbi:unnamed protein product, partial [Pylaiella littoralis]
MSPEAPPPEPVSPPSSILMSSWSTHPSLPVSDAPPLVVSRVFGIPKAVRLVQSLHVDPVIAGAIHCHRHATLFKKAETKLRAFVDSFSGGSHPLRDEHTPVRCCQRVAFPLVQVARFLEPLSSCFPTSEFRKRLASTGCTSSVSLAGKNQASVLQCSER